MHTHLTQTGTLPIGLVVDGAVHKDFELRPLTVGDQIEATEEVGADDPTHLACAMFARQLVRLGSLATDKINTKLLLQLYPADFNTVEGANEALIKKLLRDGPLSDGGQPVALPSHGTA